MVCAQWSDDYVFIRAPTIDQSNYFFILLYGFNGILHSARMLLFVQDDGVKKEHAGGAASRKISGAVVSRLTTAHSHAHKSVVGRLVHNTNLNPKTASSPCMKSRSFDL